MGISARTQPQGLARVNRSNPLASGIVALESFACRNTAHTYGNAPPIGATPQGIGPVLNGTSQNIKLGFTVSGVEGTVLLLANFQSNANCIFAQNDTSDGNIGFGIQNGSLYMTRSAQGNIGSLTGLRTVAAAWSAKRACGAYVDGIKKFVVPINAQPNGSSAYPLIVGSCSYSGAVNGYSFSAQTPLLLAYWNRALTDAEIAQATANPWQLLDAPSQTQFPQSSVIAQVFAAFRNFLHF